MAPAQALRGNKSKATVGGHKSKNWAILHLNTGVAQQDFEDIAG
jgi:hypothetical protein